MNVAIIGAGLAGLSCVYTLKPKFRCTVFEKSRGVSGRMSTRYADPFQFDHGAQYFTARDAAFTAFLQPYLVNGTVAPWHPKCVTLEKGQKPYKRNWFEPHYVAVPKMNQLCKELGQGQDIRLGTEIASVQRTDAGWQLYDLQQQDCGLYDWVISAAPAPQARRLLPADMAQREVLDSAEMTACFTLMLGFDDMLKLNFQAAIVKNSPITWIAVNNSKAGRTHKPSLVIHTDNIWAEIHKDEDKSVVESLLLTELSELLEKDITQAVQISLHRWLYASVSNAANVPYLLDSTLKLAACGDWCTEGRVEAAFLSGYKLASALNAL